MSSLLCGCPRAAAISDLTLDDCLESMGQLQKIVFQRVFKSDGSKNTFLVGTNDPDLIASWTLFLEASDDTKVVSSPFINSPEFEAGAARTRGGGNASLGGIEEVVGVEPTTFTGMVLRAKQSLIKALKTYMCENVGVYMVDQFGRIGMLSDGLDTVVNYYPIPIKSFFVGDKMPGGLEEFDSNAISFSLEPNWSDNFVLITPSDFDALYDLTA